MGEAKSWMYLCLCLHTPVWQQGKQDNEKFQALFIQNKNQLVPVKSTLVPKLRDTEILEAKSTKTVISTQVRWVRVSVAWKHSFLSILIIFRQNMPIVILLTTFLVIWFTLIIWSRSWKSQMCCQGRQGHCGDGERTENCLGKYNNGVRTRKPYLCHFKGA